MCVCVYTYIHLTIYLGIYVCIPKNNRLVLFLYVSVLMYLFL